MVLRKRRKPGFHQMNYGKPDRKRVKSAWRKPRGIDNKLKLKLKQVGSEPNIGWGNPRSLRGLHPSGLKEVLIFNLAQLDSLDAKKSAARISSKIGGKKRSDVVAKAAKLGIKVLN